MSILPTLQGRRLTLVPFGPEQISERYLGWLSDPVVNRLSQRYGAKPATAEEARTYLAGLKPDEVILAIRCPEHGHVGNIKWGPVDRANGRADISILLGEVAVWGRGYATEAIYLISRHLFLELGLHRVDAGSANPAFLGAVRRLGWTVEGVLRQRVRIGDRLVDWTLVAQLRDEFACRPEYELAKN